MACENCGDFNSIISSCGEPASKDSVVAALNKITSGSCCTGETTTVDLDPTDSSDVVDAFNEAFPDGITSCMCPCIWINALQSDGSYRVYQNCAGSANWINEERWCVDCSDNAECIGHLTTPDLDPSNSPLDAALSTEEAFGVLECETAIIFTENGTLCYTIDNGESYECLTGGGSPGDALDIYYAGSAYSAQTCSGCPSCSNNASAILRLWQNDPDLDVSNNLREEIGNALAPCISCVHSGATKRHDFKVTQDGNYQIDIEFAYTGNFALGSVGCPTCQVVGTTQVTFALIDESNAVVKSFVFGGYGGSDKIPANASRSFLINLLSSKEYAWRITINGITSGCCNCNPGYYVPGGGNITRHSYRYMGV